MFSRFYKVLVLDKKDMLIKKKVYNFTCKICHKNFTHKRHFNTHMKIHHSTNTVLEHPKLKCPLCKCDFIKAQFFNHLESVHDLPVKTQTLKFSSSEEFILWKTDFEKQTGNLFIKKHGTQKSINYTRTVYCCHRSGTFITKGKGIRRLKNSIKINGHCPAQLSVISHVDGKLNVTFTRTHVGHGSDLGNTRLISYLNYCVIFFS